MENSEVCVSVCVCVCVRACTCVSCYVHIHVDVHVHACVCIYGLEEADGVAKSVATLHKYSCSQYSGQRLQRGP